MLGNCGSAEGRWGSRRFGALGVKCGSCTELGKRLARVLVIWEKGDFQNAVLGGSSGGCSAVGARAPSSLSGAGVPVSRLRIDH